MSEIKYFERQFWGEDLKLYINEVSKFPVLKPQEEKEIGRRVLHGDNEAIQTLVVSNLRFVMAVAKEYRWSRVPLSDLINAGNMGLMIAARRFDPSRNVRFISYAVWWIRQSILEALHELRFPLYLPNKVCRALRDLRLMTGEINEIAALAGVPEKVLASLVGVSRSESLDDPGTRNGRRSRTDLSEQTKSSSSNEIYDSRVLKEHVQRSVSRLMEQERKVISLRFGLDDGVERTLREVGELMGLSRERIRQVEAKALEKLRRRLSS